MKKYSLMPLFEDNADEICDDIERQYNDNVADEALFIMTLTPEGDPVINKAQLLCKKYDVIVSKLRERGKNAGVLAQATIGHGYQLTKRAPFQHVVSLMSGDTLFRVCPYDEGFKAYIKDAFRTIALRKPTSIMVDDDFRLFATSHRGCACPLHMKAISDRIGREITREELLTTLDSSTPEARQMMRVFYETQIDSLLSSARAMREGIDSVDPTIQGSFCICGDTAEGAKDIAKILAGKDNPVIVRVHNGNYTPAGAKNLTSSMHRCAVQMSVMGDEVDVFLAETDTCPHNRHSTSASNLHAHFTCSILEGVGGCKHWITKTNNYEPKSGAAYRKKLAEYAGFYEELSSIARDVDWQGCRIPLVSSDFIPTVPITKFLYPSDINAWSTCVLEKLGLPMFFSAKQKGIACLDGNKDTFFSDEEIEKMLSGVAFIAADTAINLTKRGFGKLLGVRINDIPSNDTRASAEIINGKHVKTQMKLHTLVPASETTRERSTVVTIPDGKTRIPLFPGVTEYKNELGGTAYVFSGTPQAQFKYTEAFSFLVEPRKDQLIEFMRETGNLPIYYPGDADVYLKAGYLPTDELLCAFTNLTLDELENVILVSDKAVSEITMLLPNGKWQRVSFCEDDGALVLDTPAKILHPVILKIK